MNTSAHYDVAIIGAGMSGLAAGIRLAHFGRRVCILERHNAPGGLNGFYSIAGRKFDAGLHAVTNFTRPGVKGTPLAKLFRQLRIDRDEFALCGQKQSRVTFGPLGNPGSVSLRFTNEHGFFESEIAQKFPAQIDGYRALAAFTRQFDEISLDARPAASAREIVRRHITDPLLEDMLLCPLMYYGSAREHDMDFTQFAVMFKAVFLEGFARPLGGVRVIVRVLLEKYRAAGGERRMKCGVRKILSRNGRATALLLDDGGEITATHIISSIGALETATLISEIPNPQSVKRSQEAKEIKEIEEIEEIKHTNLPSPLPPLPSLSPLHPDSHSEIHNPKSEIRNPQSTIPAGRLSYVETISVLDRQPAALGWGGDTIVFFNESPRFMYARPADSLVDTRSGVICFPNNFDYPDGKNLDGGFFRCTCLANYDHWKNLSAADYRAAKQHWFAAIAASAKRFLPPLAAPGALEDATVATDMFTPLTVERFTGHIGGAVYGSPEKNRRGRTVLENVYLCGTDQGFLGIIGAMLSGISMANYHILQKETAGQSSARQGLRVCA